MKFAALACLIALPGLAQVKVTQGSDRILIEIDGKPFTSLFLGADTTKPYLHPLRAASGKSVTRAYPMEAAPAGGSNDHPHHRGLWFSHGDVNGFDFWANEPSQKNPKKGRIVVKKVNGVSSGKKDGSLDVTFAWVDPAGKTLLTEQRRMVFHAHPTMRILDFDATLTAAEKVRFHDTKEGTFAIRLNDPLDGKHSGKMTSSTGGIGEKQVWGKRAPWVDYAGELEGEHLGIAIFDHPANPKHPTYWHSRDYGLFAANIFGEHDFYSDKSRDGGLELEAGKSWRFRYRVIIHSGDHASAGIAGLYAAYAKTK